MASRIDDRATFVAALRAHERSAELAALCRRVVDRIAESRSVAVPRDFVAAQAEELGVGHDVVAEGVRVRAALERGPESAEEWAVVVGFALCRIAVDLESGDAARARKLVREIDALESLGVAAHPFVEATMSEPALAAILDAILTETRDDAARGRVGRARAYARVEALRDYGSPYAAGVRASVGRLLAETPLASVLGPGEGHASSVRFIARSGPLPGRGLGYALALLSGLRLVLWIGRGFLRLSGIRESAEVRLDASTITVDAKTTFGARVLRSRTTRLSRTALVAASRATRYPSLRLLVGALALALGIVLGGVLVGDGVRSGETYLLLAGAALVLGGGALDLVLGVIWPASRGRAVVELVLDQGPALALFDVADDDARATLAFVRGQR